MRIKFIMFLIFLFVKCNLIYAFTPDGKYTFKETDCSGQLEVMENDFGMDPHIVVKILTVCTNQAHICELEAKGTRVLTTADKITAQFTSIKNDDNEPAKFDIEFSNFGAKINASERGSFCGLNAYFEGSWHKDGVKQPKQKNKAKEATNFCSEYIRIKKDCYYKARKGLFADNAIKSLKKATIGEEARDSACRDGFSAYGRAGNLKNSVITKALQQEFTQCYEELTK